MTSRWSIKKKLAIMLGLLLIALVTLSISGIRGLYKYRALARGVSCRSAELPLASEFAQHVSKMRADARLGVEMSRVATQNVLSMAPASDIVRNDSLSSFRSELADAQAVIDEYRQLISRNQRIEESDWRIDANKQEDGCLMDISTVLSRISNVSSENKYWVLDEVERESVVHDLEELQGLSKRLPSYLQNRMANFKKDVSLEYRSAIVISWVTTGITLLLLALLGRLLYVWLLSPIRTLLYGSRLVAAGNFSHRIHLDSKDEMAELSAAMNQMTRRFQTIRNDLDEKVRERTKQVVRSEQMAGVGFLAAGVAHEINNPLASIALCAESLEDRLHDIIQKDDALPDDEHNQDITICRDYLRMMQDEAFRCKEITGRLLDFARLGEVERQYADLSEVVKSVVEVASHLRKHQEKKIVCEADEPVLAWMNPQEIKQVVLNLVTNALDSLDEGGQVTIRLAKDGEQAKLSVIDDGCGMDDETLKHIFEPFFTRRRDGSGTGLGMSITYRIIIDHGGQITPTSAGPGKGSQMAISLPLRDPAEKKELRYQQAA